VTPPGSKSKSKSKSKPEPSRRDASKPATRARSTKRDAEPQRLLNRELGALAFNRRVLAQAEDAAIPVLERLRFLCIVDSNIDEFFEIRVAGLKADVLAGSRVPGPDGLSPAESFRRVAAEAHELVERLYRVYNEAVVPGLAAEGIRIVEAAAFTPPQRAWAKDYFLRELMPVLTPIGIDPAHPFPRLINKSLNFVVELGGKDAFGRRSGIAIVQAPRLLPRMIPLPADIAGCRHGFVPLAAIIRTFVGELFTGMTVRGSHAFQLTRNSDLFVDQEELEEVKSLRKALQGELRERHYGDSVRLEISADCPATLCETLQAQFDLTPEDVYPVNGPVNLVRVGQIIDRIDRPELKFEPFLPAPAREFVRRPDLFAAIRHADILLHHPYQSFVPVLNFIRQAVFDPGVVAIKMTVYRTGTESELMEILLAAAHAGKEVSVVVELMARFDEETNINWAERLEEAGARVVYGVVGHKTHAKMAMIVRREEGGLRRYVHVATGNYHPRTTRLYTDFGLFTANENVCSDVNDVFMQLTGLGRASRLKHLWQAPFNLHDRMLRAIRNESRLARAGRPARIIAQMNALLEPRVHEALYEASQAGVRIDLVVRGVCALRPGIPGVSDNIRVRSVIGRFLEHSRVFLFHNDGAEDVYLSSADWMDRNFFRRIEICIPVLDPKAKRRVIEEGLKPYLMDNVQAWEMDSRGDYRRRKPGKAKPYSAQQVLLAAISPDTSD
jgi:polyphosphate kinase